MACIYISAAHKSSGKTVIATGLGAALRVAGHSVQAFKKGPDYIDPMWLTLAAESPCRNLDFHTMSRHEILATCGRFGAEADVSLIEGTKGLHDGVDPEGADSNAAMAKLLDAPVVLVLDVRGITRGVAPLLKAQAEFDPTVRTAGVILNRVGGARHESKLRAAVERYTDIEVLGAVAEDPTLGIPEGHLGLLPSNDHPRAAGIVANAARAVRSQVDLERLLDIARSSIWPSRAIARPDAALRSCDIRIGVARDAAFGFYYPGDLEALRSAGAELCFFDTLRDEALPEVDGLFIGGGFPERHAEALAANRRLRRTLRERIEGGLPVYAECGGLMYLSRSLTRDGRRYPMAGAVEADTVMCDRPQGRGYVLLRETGKSPWPLVEGGACEAVLHAHEFHYSALHDIGAGVEFAYEVLRGRGVDGAHDGVVVRNVLASYSHLREVAAHPWTRRFVSFVRECRKPVAARVSL